MTTAQHIKPGNIFIQPVANAIVQCTKVCVLEAIVEEVMRWYEYAESKQKDWIVAESTSGFWYVISVERFIGIKKASEPNGGHFTGTTHLSSTISAVSTNYTWQEAGATTSYTTSVATAIVLGTVTHNGSLPGSIFIPSTSRNFSFQTVFP